MERAITSTGKIIKINRGAIQSYVMLKIITLYQCVITEIQFNVQNAFGSHKRDKTAVLNSRKLNADEFHHMSRSRICLDISGKSQVVQIPSYASNKRHRSK